MRKFLKDESGVTAIEYSLIAAAMCVALIVAMPLISNNIQTAFTNLANHVLTGQ